MFKISFFVIIYLILLFFCLFILRMLFCLAYSKLASKKSRQDNSGVDSDAPIPDAQNHGGLKQKIILAASGFFWYQTRVVGRIPSQFIRIFLYRHVFGMKMGKNVVVYGGAEIRNPWNIVIGDGSVLGDDSKLDGRKGLIIGKNVNFSTGVWIWTDEHDKDDPYFRSNNKGGPVVIGDRAWISSRTTILPNITIGEGAVVAAGAVVTKNVDAYSVVGGIPAKIIGQRNHDLKYEFDGRHLWFI